MLGIDPGLACTGLGVIARDPGGCRHLHHEVVRTDASVRMHLRLGKISAAVAAACAEYQPACAAIERTFVNVNPASSLALGQARGAALAALGLAEMEVHELVPTVIKKRITGDPTADKKLVATVVKGLLNFKPSAKLPADAADALAIALCHALYGGTLRLRSWRRRRR